MTVAIVICASTLILVAVYMCTGTILNRLDDIEAIVKDKEGKV